MIVTMMVNIMAMTMRMAIVSVIITVHMSLLVHMIAALFLPSADRYSHMSACDSAFLHLLRHHRYFPEPDSVYSFEKLLPVRVQL
jgi:hypothetical protein